MDEIKQKPFNREGKFQAIFVAHLGKEIYVTKKDSTEVVGKLMAFQPSHYGVILEKLTITSSGERKIRTLYIRGDEISEISFGVRDE